jgi:AraC-like DNA-binding protein
MMTQHPDRTAPPDDTVIPTVSRAFLEDWLLALRKHCPPALLKKFLGQTGLSENPHPQTRVTHDQIVQLYQSVAVETGDEMMGLWSRPIRSGALKHLCTSMRGTSSFSAALFRFTTFWNLLLDDYCVVLDTDSGYLRLSLHARDAMVPQRFGHMLMLKLTHGIASWLAGHELALRDVSFGFDQPDFAADYPILFPAAIRFGQENSSITFDTVADHLPACRSEAEMLAFLSRAPRDWIFTGFREHSVALRVRELILLSDHLNCRLDDAARALILTPRTLIRRLNAENTSFQAIKDGVRRDIAIRDLARGAKTIEAISHDIGFASTANFHRAFHRWMAMTPGAYRRGGAAL